MAANFKISPKNKSKNLLLRLSGDFDGSSALELINTLKDNYSKAEKIVIDTQGLCSIHPFGRDVFWKNCTLLNKKSRNVIFTGAHSRQLTPEDQVFSS
jgi:anti-anti-sigma regulatory factor